MEHKSQHGSGVQVSGGGHCTDTTLLFERGQQTGRFTFGRSSDMRVAGRTHYGQRPCGGQDVQHGLDQGSEVLVQPARPESGARVRRLCQRIASVADHRVSRRTR